MFNGIGDGESGGARKAQTLFLDACLSPDDGQDCQECGRADSRLWCWGLCLRRQCKMSVEHRANC